MKAFARLTSIIFIALGVLIILIGAYFAISGFFAAKDTASAVPSMFSDMSGLVVLARLFAGTAVSLQGLFLAAFGQVVWLLTDISDQTQKTSEYLGSLARRASQAKQ